MLKIEKNINFDLMNSSLLKILQYFVMLRGGRAANSTLRNGYAAQ